MRVVITGSQGHLGSYVVQAMAGEHEVVGLDARPGADVTASILDGEALKAAFDGAATVLHIAAAANISSGSDRHIVEVNALGSWTVLDAALQAGVRRVVLCSSDSVMGNTVWRQHYRCPDALPVPEDHALRPADPYALSKLMAEEAGRSFAFRHLEVIALRPVFILFPSMMGEVRARHADPQGYRGPQAGGHVGAGGGLCWHHVDPRDVADAFRRAATCDWQGYEAFWLAAASTLHPMPTLELIERTFGRLPERTDRSVYEANPFAPMFDITKAEAKLGWRAVHDHRANVVCDQRTSA